MAGKNKELSKDSVFSREVNQSNSPINYVLMLSGNTDFISGDKLALTEAELFIKRLFVQGDFKQFADKYQISRNDFKSILYEVSVLLSKNKISCIVGLILKTEGETRDVIVCRTGKCSPFIINAKDAYRLNEEVVQGDKIVDPSKPRGLIKPQLFSGKLKKEDTLILCSESLSSALEIKFIQRIVNSSKTPEEVCKKLLHSASQTAGREAYSVAVFSGLVKKKHPVKVKIPNKYYLPIILVPVLIVAGFLIYYFSYGSKDKHLEKVPVSSVEPINPPAVINKDSVAGTTLMEPRDTKKNEMVPESVKNIKKAGKEITETNVDNAKKTKKVVESPPVNIAPINKNLTFLVNGTVVLISNWESIAPAVKNINWGNGVTDRNNIHKYSDYASIPSSVRVTFKDNTVKSFKIK